MNKEMYKKRKEFWELKEKFAELGGNATILSEVKKLIEHQEIHNEKDFLDKLKQYLDEKEKEFWKESTPIAKKMCDTNIEMAKIYMKEKKMNLEEFKKIYEWVESRTDESSAIRMNMAIKVATVINSVEKNRRGEKINE